MNKDLIDPRGLSVIEWTDAMVFPLIDRSRPPRLETEDAWKEWALTVVQSARISRMNPPDPRLFDDWREWAFRFNQAIS